MATTTTDRPPVIDGEVVPGKDVERWRPPEWVRNLVDLEWLRDQYLRHRAYWSRTFYDRNPVVMFAAAVLVVGLGTAVGWGAWEGTLALWNWAWAEVSGWLDGLL